MSGRKLYPKQKKVNERMQMANTAARRVMADPRLKQRACEMLQVEPNKVFRAIVKQFMLTDGYGGIFEEIIPKRSNGSCRKNCFTPPFNKTHSLISCPKS
jgi:hypothetical protein